MKLDRHAEISESKLTQYLLEQRPQNDKSGFFALAGYTRNNWQQLEADLRQQILPRDAELSRQTPYGDLYTITGALRGPNREVVQIVSVWLVQPGGGTRLVTVYPERRQRSNGL